MKFECTVNGVTVQVTSRNDGSESLIRECLGLKRMLQGVKPRVEGEDARIMMLAPIWRELIECIDRVTAQAEGMNHGT